MGKSFRRRIPHTTYAPPNVGTVVHLRRGALRVQRSYRHHPPPPPNYQDVVWHAASPLLILLLLCFGELQLPPAVYCQLEAILLSIFRLSVRLHPAYIVGCFVEVRGYTNRDGKNSGSAWRASWLKLIAFLLASCVVLSGKWLLLLAVSHGLGWRVETELYLFALHFS